MKVSIISDMAVRYEGERYYKGDELVIKKEYFNAAIMKELEETKEEVVEEVVEETKVEEEVKAAPKKAAPTKAKKETE